LAVVESTLLRTIEDSFCWAWWRQQKKHGEASKSNGDVTRNNTPRPKNADTTYQNEKIGLKRYVLHKVTLKKHFLQLLPVFYAKRLKFWNGPNDSDTDLNWK
jgi:hypothetical protein